MAEGDEIISPWLGGQPFTETQAFGVCELVGDCPHTGIDVGAPTGTPIYLPWAGTVREVVNQGGFGNEEIVTLDQFPGAEFILGHESAFTVTPGHYAGGTEIGEVGSTGFSTGSHLHFQENLGGQPVDPIGALTGSIGGQGPSPPGPIQTIISLIPGLGAAGVPASDVGRGLPGININIDPFSNLGQQAGVGVSAIGNWIHDRAVPFAGANVIALAVAIAIILLLLGTGQQGSSNSSPSVIPVPV